jgi:hypothetical protein
MRRHIFVRAGASWLRQINASGKSKKSVNPHLENIPLVTSGKSALPARPVLSRQEGRIAIVTNAGGDAVDATASARNLFAGRFFREWTTARETTAPKRTAKACGSGTRCWCQAAGGGIDPTGFDFAIKPAATVTRRIRRRGERAISRKTIARGMPECFR